MRICRHLRSLALLVGLSLLPSINAVYGSEIIRVALEQQATRVDIVSTDLFQIQLSSHKSVTQRGPFTIRPDGDLLEIAGHQVRVKDVRIRGKSPTMKVSLTPGSTGEWVIGGNIHITHQGSRLQVVNRLDVEEYVTGVVASEISSSWHPEALKAQAVAARTYVLYKKMLNSEEDFDVVASVQDQVYTGHQQVTESIKEAIDQTRGEVITFERRPIFAAYSSTAAGPTEDANNVWSLDVPYLKGVDCPFDAESPRYTWQASVPFDTVEQQLQKEGYPVGTLATLTPYTFTQAGRVNEIRILHSKGELIVRGQDFRRVVGYRTIPSTQFHVESIGRDVVLAGKGAGHAVGLCQWGTKEMAELGYRYTSILQYYYPGTKLRQVDDIILVPPLTP